MKVIELTKGKVALVDDDDYERVSNYLWCFSSSYAIRGIVVDGRRTSQYLHKYILGIEEEVDHINRNKLDCQKHNLRSCSSTQNSRNQGFKKGQTSKGVDQLPGLRWRAYITVDKKRIHIGTYATKQLAMDAYDRMAILAFGEFACTNKELLS